MSRNLLDRRLLRLPLLHTAEQDITFASMKCSNPAATAVLSLSGSPTCGMQQMLGVPDITVRPRASSCQAFVNELDLPNTTLLAAGVLPANTTLPLTGAHHTCMNEAESPVDVCRLALAVSTSSSSTTIIEAWLLMDWNGKNTFRWYWRTSRMY